MKFVMLVLVQAALAQTADRHEREIKRTTAEHAREVLQERNRCTHALMRPSTAHVRPGPHQQVYDACHNIRIKKSRTGRAWLLCHVVFFKSVVQGIPVKLDQNQGVYAAGAESCIAPNHARRAAPGRLLDSTKQRSHEHACVECACHNAA